MHNNIFFSFAVDADLEQLSKKSTDANSKTWSTDTLHGSSEKSSEFQVSSGGKNDGSSSEDLINGMEVTQDIPSEAHSAESEQATCASANNDLKGTKAYQEADVPGLHTLAMAIIDYRGHRVVAQVCYIIEVNPLLTSSFLKRLQLIIGLKFLIVTYSSFFEQEVPMWLVGILS